MNNTTACVTDSLPPGSTNNTTLANTMKNLSQLHCNIKANNKYNPTPPAMVKPTVESTTETFMNYSNTQIVVKSLIGLGIACIVIGIIKK
jgi:hypothetical protein